MKVLATQNVASQADLDHTIDRVKTTWKEVEAAKTQKAVKRIQLDLPRSPSPKPCCRSRQYNFDQQTGSRARSTASCLALAGLAGQSARRGERSRDADRGMSRRKTS